MALGRWHSAISPRITGGNKKQQSFAKKDNFGGNPMKKIQPIFAAMTLSIAGSFMTLAQQPQQQAPPQPMSFFVTSAGSGKGANLGGLAGADRICQTLAATAGGGNKTWHAYLSTSGANGQP